MEKYKVSVHSQNSAFLGHSNSSFSRGGCWKYRVLQLSIPRGWFCGPGSVNKCYGRQNTGVMDMGQNIQGMIQVRWSMFKCLVESFFAMEVIIMK